MKRLIINDSLKSGTQLPFIKRAINEGYGVVVLNTNQNYIVGEDGRKHLIRVRHSLIEKKRQTYNSKVKVEERQPKITLQ